MYESPTINGVSVGLPHMQFSKSGRGDALFTAEKAVEGADAGEP